MLLPMLPIREPNAKPPLLADLEPSEPDDRQVDLPVDRLTLLMFNTLLKPLIQIDYDCTEASQWLGKKLSAISEISLSA